MKKSKNNSGQVGRSTLFIRTPRGKKPKLASQLNLPYLMSSTIIRYPVQETFGEISGAPSPVSNCPLFVRSWTSRGLGELLPRPTVTGSETTQAAPVLPRTSAPRNTFFLQY